MNKLLQTHEKDLISYMNYKSTGQDSDMQPLQPIVEEDNPTGFEDQMEALLARLDGSSNNRIVIPIVGMSGSGKTTFAKQIFHGRNKLKTTFVHTIWVHVSQNFARKQKYIDMLYEITKHPRDEYSNIPENQLEDKIKELLKDKYFIVLDDIWEKNDWNSLNKALPENSKGSRVLVTTRFRELVDTDEEPHDLRSLNNEESWELLEKIIFGKDGCPNESTLKTVGEDIVKRCKGLPLSIVMVGGILRRSRSLAYWKRVAENPIQEINKRDKSYHKVVRLSYDHLPHEKLRNCFLYFASFPMGQEIAALKLIRLWIAEEFIPSIDEWGYSLDLEDEAENYLKDLVDRNLVIVMKRSADGQIKTCRIHDSLHEFCKTEASKNNLFHIIDGEQKLDANTVSSHRRRLCFHSSSSSAKIFDVEDGPSCLFLNCYNKMKKKSPYPSGEHVHSLLLSSSQESDIDLKQEELIAIPNAFPLLRVLDIESFKLSFQLPNELFSLNLLKYLAITTNVNLLPKAFKNLRELQTLVIKTTEGTLLEINGGIWNMEKLRHLQTNASMQLPSPQNRWKNKNGKTNIRTLSWISPRSCQKEIFSKTPHLKKLGVRGDLVELLKRDEQEICLFNNNLQMLNCLENLKLYGQDENELKVPMLDKFRLRKLTFCQTFFKWDDMKILGSLEELEVLKLDKNAFRGEQWDLKSNVVFNQLQYLRIGRTNLKTWTIVETSFPVLENLVLRNCTNLEVIPIEFAEVHNLKVIELYHMSENATNSAYRVDKQRRNNENIKGLLDLKITHLPPQTTAHEEQTDGKENVNTSSIPPPSPTTRKEQTNGEENINTSGFELPSSSIPPPPPTLTNMTTPVVGEDNYVVGFGDEVKMLKDRLFRESMNLTVISIVGMIGVGKTTFAKMLFNDREIVYEFFSRGWVNFPETYTTRQIFFDILRSLTMTSSNDFHEMSDINLAERIYRYLKGRKYLIVLDDVWIEDCWDDVKIVFPNEGNGSRILVTTRHLHVASYIDSSGTPHKLKGLSDEECWELLEKKIFGGSRCPDSSLEAVGKSIAKKCNGVPLVVGTKLP
ncbi:PREDICTED: putative late blight resistance protein homolog R1A-10 [Ipomoea nil]|uniref:putative late blight resistance protein homolog R1A-10 n=1 Tax=Ipomoea nil TaxID=35883 RepID=UPI0009008F1F|nr:PREDICTED: putative late blight resistance protein homolog R1A-10 [Ipomoea nil]